jgi:hypothetical protein
VTRNCSVSSRVRCRTARPSAGAMSGAPWQANLSATATRSRSATAWPPG